MNIKRVQGNYLQMTIPLQEEMITSGGVVVSDYHVQEGSSVSVVLSSAYNKLEYQPVRIEDNKLFVVDNGVLTVGKYAVEVIVVEPDGTRLRSKYHDILNVVDANEDMDGVGDDPKLIEGNITISIRFHE